MYFGLFIIWRASFLQCTVHSASGLNTRRTARHALQLRFMSDPQTGGRGIGTPYPELGPGTQSTVSNQNL